MAPRPPPVADALRARLEDAAPVLEAALEPLRSLTDALAAFRWRSRLEQLGATLEAQARQQPTVDALLVRARRRALAEGWPVDAPTSRLLAELESLGLELARLAHRRLKVPASLAPAEVLAELLRRLPSAPRLVLPSEAMAEAARILPPTLPELTPAVRLGDAAERALRGVERPDAVDPAALERLERAWGPGLLALEGLWRRVEGVDQLGTIRRALRQAARHTPPPPPRTGPRALLHAQHWRDRTQRAVDDLFQVRLAPVVVPASEWFSTWRWLVATRAGADHAPATGGLTPGRAALLHLALALNGNPGLAGGGWSGLAEQARAADEEPGTRDWRALAGALDGMIRAVLSAPPGDARPLRPALLRDLPPPVDDTLLGRVTTLERLLRLQAR